MRIARVKGPFRRFSLEKSRKPSDRGANLIGAGCEKEHSENQVLGKRRFLLAHGAQAVDSVPGRIHVVEGRDFITLSLLTLESLSP